MCIIGSCTFARRRSICGVVLNNAIEDDRSIRPGARTVLALLDSYTEVGHDGTILVVVRAELPVASIRW
jgi:hypothetical protein